MPKALKKTHKINVIRRRGSGMPPEYHGVIRAAAGAALAYLKADLACAVDVTVTDEEEIREVNAESRGIDRVTDVLSFPMLELAPDTRLSEAATPADFDEGRLLIGEMLLCFPRAKEQAAEFGHSLARELSFLTVHSMLHLFGYDHEKSPEEDALTQRMTEEILAPLGLSKQESAEADQIITNEVQK